VLAFFLKVIAYEPESVKYIVCFQDGIRGYVIEVEEAEVTLYLYREADPNSANGELETIDEIQKIDTKEYESIRPICEEVIAILHEMPQYRLKLLTGSTNIRWQ
jgi:hypothetical protein